MTIYQIHHMCTLLYVNPTDCQAKWVPTFQHQQSVNCSKLAKVLEQRNFVQPLETLMCSTRERRFTPREEPKLRAKLLSLWRLWFRHEHNTWCYQLHTESIMIHFNPRQLLNTWGHQIISHLLTATIHWGPMTGDLTFKWNFLIAFWCTATRLYTYI